jgi:hypothetical protein
VFTASLILNQADLGGQRYSEIILSPKIVKYGYTSPDEIKSRLNSVRNLLSSRLISKSLKIKIYKIVILPVVLYGCETWSLTLREEHRLRVFESRVLRRIFEPRRKEEGTWRKLHNDELHSLYSSPNIVKVIKSRRMRWAGYVACMGEGRVVYRVWVGRSGGKKPLGRSRRRLEDNIKMNLTEIGIDGANWIRLAQERVQCRAFVNMVMNLRVPKESRIFFDKLIEYQFFK